MTWRLGKISVTNSTPAPGGGPWRLGKISVTTGASTTWRLGKVSVTGTTAPPTVWRLGKISVAITGGWRLSKVSVTSSQFVVPVVAASYVGGPIDPVAPAVSSASISNGVVPDFWTWHLGTTPGGSDLDSYLGAQTFGGTGGSIAWSPPGSPTGATVYMSVTATKGAQTSASVVQAYPVLPADTYYLDPTGLLRAMSPSYYLKG